MAKTDKELAAEMTIALLNHNASLHVGGINGSDGASKDGIINAQVVATNYAYLLSVVEGKTNPLQQNKK